MGGHTTTNSQDTLSCLHTGDIFGRGLKTNKNDLLALLSPGYCIISSKYNLTAGSTGRCTKTLTDRSCSLQSLCIELRMKQSVEVTRIDHQHCFFFSLMTFVYQVTGDLQSCGSGSLTVTALEHIEFLVLNSKLHILHIMIMVLKEFANLDELSVCFGEFFFHLSNGHRSTNTCYYVLALCIDEELTHQLVLAGCRITGKCYTGTGLII